ncbi:MAG: ABC transporter ATP-binding protein [Eubacterium sp.]|nr:ABC transporter ATP-binding protein [Eubacterium sp.]
MKMLEIENLSVRYESLTIVDEVNFSVEEGQWLMIAGPNGAGKSTILRAVTSGTSYEGSIRLNGRDMSQLKPKERAAQVGVLLQNYYVGYDFTVGEIVKLGRYAHAGGILTGKKEEDEKAVEEALALTGLTVLKDHSALTLSGGELQRTFLAQVLAQDPALLLLDEPTNHLDPFYQKQVFGLIAEWVKRPGKAVISVVHDLSLAKTFGSHALLINKGKKIAMGTMDEVFCAENLNRVYGMDLYAWMQQLFSGWKK